MPSVFFRPPQQLVNEWPEVFADLSMSSIPVTYLHAVQMEFVTGMVWHVDIQEQLEHTDPARIAEVITSTIELCQSDLESVSYRFDTDRFRQDAQSLAEQLLSSRPRN